MGLLSKIFVIVVVLVATKIPLVLIPSHNSMINFREHLILEAFAARVDPFL